MSIKEKAIEISLNTYKDRLNLEYPSYRPEYAELFTEEQFIDFNKCGFCIMHRQECSVCEFGKVFGICVEKNSLYDNLCRSLIRDNCLGDYKSKEVLKTHKKVCKKFIKALNKLTKE